MLKRKSVIKFCCVILAITTLMGCMLTGCGSDDRVKLNVYNWGEYMANGDDDSLNIEKEFEAKYPNIDVVYTTYDTNEILYAKLKTGSVSYDVIIPSDYMISRMISEDMLQKIDFNNIPNFQSIMDKFKNLDYDPTNEYSVPYTWGTVGIIYNKEKITEPVTSWDILWDKDYEGRVLMFDNPRDAFGIALKKLGYSQNTTDTDKLLEAAEELKAQREVCQAYVMDDIFNKMEIGEAWAAPYYAGDFMTMVEENEDLAWCMPEEGSNMFFDAMCIPKNAKHKYEAELFINFLLEKEIGKSNIEYIKYSTPNQLVYDALSDEVKNSEVSYPSQEILDKCDVFVNLPEDVNQFMQDLWPEIKGGN